MLNSIKNEIDKYNNIILSAHVFPDGDAIGSLIALKLILEKYAPNKKISIILQDEKPYFSKYFKETDCIKNNFEENEIELVIQLDTANIDRAAIDKNIYKLAKKTINIDHHISNDKYLDINYVKDVSSTAEIVYEILEFLNVPLDENIAKYIYLGIINDTGNFRHNNVSEKTFLIASKLIKEKINISEISRALFSKSVNKAKIFGEVLLNFKYIEEYNFAYYYLNQEKMKELKITKFDADGISELLLSIEDVKIALYLREENDGNIKGSFRSINRDVNKIAALLNGGGHTLAAGFKSKKEEKEIFDIVINSLKSDI